MSDGRGLGAKLECDRDERDDLRSPATFEISQTHSKDRTVVKRAMNASPALVRKLSMNADDFHVFAVRLNRRMAFASFHFHPDYPLNKREESMIANLDGLKLLNETAPSSGPCTEKSDRRDQFKDWFLRVAGVFKPDRPCVSGKAMD